MRRSIKQMRNLEGTKNGAQANFFLETPAKVIYQVGLILRHGKRQKGCSFSFGKHISLKKILLLCTGSLTHYRELHCPVADRSMKIPMMTLTLWQRRQGL